MKLRHRLGHALRKPPRVIAWKLAHRALRQVRRVRYWAWLDGRLRDELRRVPIDELRKALQHAPQLIDPARLNHAAAMMRTGFPEETSALVAQADEIMALKFSYLGWTRQYEGLPLPWTSDWGTGRVWESAYYADYDYSEPGRPSDVKSCWEPSRFHFGVRLGQAYRLTGNVAYERCFFALLRDWFDVNPLAHSINWTSPLEVAIRGVNLAAALALFADAPESDLRYLVELLAVHGAFLTRNLEYTDVRGNHYTGNLLGLLTLGFLLESVVPEAAQWRQHAERRMSVEILLQFLPDGVNFEKSLPYHRFVTEMFVLCGLLLERAGRPLDSTAIERLRAAAHFTAAYMRPDGRAPVVGDNDDARALPLGTLPPADHRHLLATASLLTHSSIPLAPSDRARAEAVWLSAGGEITDEAGAPGSTAFPAGGFYVARHGSNFALMDAGTVGLQSGGCHGHHDMLSFELALDGTALLVDAGSPAYTGDVATKNVFRRTAAHNTAMVDRVEQGSFDPSRLWHLGGEAVPRDVRFVMDAAGTTIEAAHAGYERLPDPVVHQRRLTLSRDGGFEGADSFLGRGSHSIELFFHFDAAVQVLLSEDRNAQLTSGMNTWRFVWLPTDVETTASMSEVSPSYGVRTPAPLLHFKWYGPLPWHFQYRIEKS